MPSTIDPTHPATGIAVSKAASRANWAAAKAELEHGGFFLAHSGAVERRTQDKLREPGVSVIDFGADPTGAADSTSAIQQAIDAVGAAGGGVVHLPPGNYRIMPQASVNVDAAMAEAALFINHDNVTLQGAGMLATRLFFRVFGDLDPVTNWEVKTAGGTVHRGALIVSRGKVSDLDPRRNIRLRDLQLDGGAGNTGAASGNPGNSAAARNFPANPATGDGWDVTHKGFVPEANKSHEDILLERVWLHRCRGELTWHGGNLVRRVTFRDSLFGDTNANAWNIACADFFAERNYVYDCEGAISEDAAVGDYVYIGNRFYNCPVSGLYFARIDPDNINGVLPRFTAIGNQWEKCGKGITIASGSVVVSGNTFVDMGELAILLLQPPNDVPYNMDRSGILIEGNLVKAVAVGCPSAISLYGDATSPLVAVTIRDNHIVCPAPGTAAITSAFLYYLGGGAADRDVVIDGNHVVGCHRFIQSGGNWPADFIKLPLIGMNNVVRCNEQDDWTPHFQQGTPDITVSGGATEPMASPPAIRFDHATTFAEPTITASHYMKGQRFKILGPSANAPTYIPRRSASWRCRTDRFLYAGCELIVEFDGTRFVEIGWVDNRADAETTVASGTTLDAQGRDVVGFSFGSPTTVTAHQAVPEGLPITVYATNGNATLANNAALATTSGANLTLAANRPYRFVRLGSVLRQMD
jgi:hypothetical protein